jgi:predicted ATPase
MLKLTKISLEGYKSIRECRDLAVGDLNVLIGANGAGKSNLISFFRLLNAAMRGELQVHVGQQGAAHSLLHNGPKATGEIRAALQFEDAAETNLYALRLLFSAPDNLTFASETFRTEPKAGSASPPAELVARGASESAVVQPGFRENERLKLFARFFGGIRTYHFHDTSERADIRLSRRVEDHRQLYSNGENLAPVLRYLRDHQPNSYARIVETVRLVAPFFGDFSLDTPSILPGHVLLNWRARGSDYQLGPHQLSDGTLRFMALATLLLQPAGHFPDVIVIDEPELGLHPYAVKILASLLADAASRTQVLVATQSAGLVDEMEPQDVIVANLEEGVTSLERLDPERLSTWLQDYTLSQMWESNLFGGRP